MKGMDAEIVTLGNELLLGRTIDTNATWLARWLDRRGFRVVRKSTVGDESWLIEDAIRHALGRANLVVTTGGLGPTHDDVTKHAIANVFGVELRTDPKLKESLAALYERRGRPFTEDRQTMAKVPDGFEWLANPIGTAPGLIRRIFEPTPQCLMVLPGVPYEMQAIVEWHGDQVLAFLGESGSAHSTFRTAGVTENKLHERLRAVIADLPDGVSIAFLPDPVKGVAVRLSSRGATPAEAQSKHDLVAAAIQTAIGKYVYGGEDDSLEAVVGDLLREKGKSLALAESCTGGLIGDRITDIPGSSDYFRGGFVTYGNPAKIRLLGVDAALLDAAGAVSSEVAEQMAGGCRERFGSDIGLSVTGIAGPSGGTPEKPVGTVWIGYADGHGTMSFQLRLTDNRRLNKELASTGALNLLRRRLCGIAV